MNNFYNFWYKGFTLSVRISHISSYFYDSTTEKLSLYLIGKENPIYIADINNEKYQSFVNTLNNSETVKPSYMT